jgi:hypothetical protein
MECLKLLGEYQLLKDALAEVMLNEFCSRLIVGMAVSNLAVEKDVSPLRLLCAVQLVASVMGSSLVQRSPIRSVCLCVI